MEYATEDLISVLEDSLIGDFKVELIDLSDYPVFFAAAMPTRAFATGEVPRLPCGRGLTRQAAILSALGEAAELRASLARKETFPSLECERHDGFAYLPVENLVTGAFTGVIAQRIFLDWAAAAGEALVFDAGSSGCAAWTDLAGATERGLLECIERDARALWWHGKLRCPTRPRDCLDDVEPRLSWWLQQRQRNFALIDITCDTRVPVAAAASWEPDGSHIAVGTAAAPAFADALLSAAIEMLQTELAMTVGGAAENDELQAWVRQTNAGGLMQLAGAISEVVPEPVTTPLVEHLRALDIEALRFDFTAPGDVLHAVRMMLPGLGGIRQYCEPDRIMAFVGRHPELTDVRTASELDYREPY